MFNHLKNIVKSVFVLLVFIAGSSLLAFAEGGPGVPAGAPPAPGAGPGQPSQPGLGGMIIPFVLMFGVMYFLIIRPQKKKMQEQQNMLSGLKHGDQIVTTSGIFGTVTGITDKVVTVEVANNVRVKMLKSQVSQIIKGDQIKDMA